MIGENSGYFSDEWISKRTGISQRRVLDEDKPAYQLGVDAAKKALDDAGIEAEELDLIIVTTETPDYLTPSMSCIIQSKIGAQKLRRLILMRLARDSFTE